MRATVSKVRILSPSATSAVFSACGDWPAPPREGPPVRYFGLALISQMRARLVHITYLIAITTAMVGWGWLIFTGVKWLVS
jgi:hypothetical protein